MSAKPDIPQDCLLPVLHDVQAEFGCIDAEAEARIAGALNLSRAEVHGVVSFYPDFTARADARVCVQLCRAEACTARGGGELFDTVAVVWGGRVRLVAAYCLGLCTAGPAARVDGTLYARLDTARLVALVDAS